MFVPILQEDKTTVKNFSTQKIYVLNKFQRFNIQTIEKNK